MAVTLFTHDGYNSLCYPKQTEYVGFDLVPCFLLGSFFNSAKKSITGIVDQHVDAAKKFFGVLNSGKVSLTVIDIQLDRQYLFTIFFNQVIKVRQVAGCSCNTVSSFKKRFCP